MKIFGRNIFGSSKSSVEKTQQSKPLESKQLPENQDEFKSNDTGKTEQGLELNKQVSKGQSLPPNPFSLQVSASKKQIISQAKKAGVPIEPEYFARAAGGKVDDNYYLNALEAQTKFAGWMKKNLTGRSIKYQDFVKIHQDIHHTAAMGNSGDRRYLNMTDNMVEMYRPGQLRSDAVTSRMAGIRPGTGEYCKQVADQLGISLLEDGPVPIPGVPQDKDQSINKRDLNTHIYPLGGKNLEPYLKRGAQLFQEIGKLKGRQKNSSQAVELIGQYYHAMINAKPFEQINNSLLMGEVNVMLSHLGHPPVSHGWIDHLAYRTSPEAFGKVMLAHTQGKVPPPSAFDINLP